jgi:hypothetical protein
MAPPAAFPGTTQAEPHLPLRPAPRLAVVVAAVQLAATQAAAFRASLLSQIRIDFFQQLE